MLLFPSLSYSGIPGIGGSDGPVFVGGKTHAINVGSTGTSTSISLTDLTGGVASAPAENDIVVGVYAVGSTANEPIGVDTAGYTELAELHFNDTNDANLSVSWKRMGVSPDTEVTVSPTGDALAGGCHQCHAISESQINASSPTQSLTTLHCPETRVKEPFRILILKNARARDH